MICGNPHCPLGKIEFQTNDPNQRFCSRSCATKVVKPWRQAVDKRIESVRRKRQERIQKMPPEALERSGYSRGYQAARYQYHYRNFLKRLAALLSSGDDA